MNDWAGFYVQNLVIGSQNHVNISLVDRFFPSLAELFPPGG